MTEQLPSLPLLWLSDLHLDQNPATARHTLGERVARSAEPALLLTGDLSNANQLVADLEWLADIAQRPLYFVLGNHDHYGGSVGEIRDAVTALAERRPTIRWLPPAGMVALDGDTALVGVDGWADGRIGNALTTRFRLNDDRLIAELAAQPTRAAKLAIKRALADADAARLAVLLERAIPTARTIVIATHIPPFAEALPSRGHLADPDWPPLLVCGATGTVIRQAATNHPETQFVVLCGHTHVATDTTVMGNVRCLVAGG